MPKFSRLRLVQFIMVWPWETNGRSNASKLEARIKQLTKAQKEELIKTTENFNIYFEMLDKSAYVILGETK